MNRSIIEGALSQIMKQLIVIKNSFERVNETIRGTSPLINSINLDRITTNINQTASEVAETLSSVTANSEPAQLCLPYGK